MGYQIVEKLLPRGRMTNRPGTRLSPVGVIVHETATPGATAEAEYRYFASGYRGASAHYFVDDKTILRVIPENEVAWHAGPTANRLYLSVELCHFRDRARFEEVWKRGVWLVADICRRYGWDPKEAVRSHAWVSHTYKETDHTDPIGYFALHGKSWNQFVVEVQQELARSAVKEVFLVFKDTVNHWAKESIERLAKLGIFKGDEKGYFRPDEPVTRAQLAVVIDRVLKLLGR